MENSLKNWAEFAFFQPALSRSFLPAYLVKCRWTLLKLNSKRPYPSSEREIKCRRCLFMFSIKHEIRHFHKIVVQKRQRNVQKKNVMHVPCLRSRCGRVGGSLSPYWQVSRKLSKLTNYRVYQELIYRNVLKTMLTGSTYTSLPSSPAVFAQLFSMRFPHYLGAWNRLAQGSRILCFVSRFCSKTMHSLFCIIS